MRSNTRYLATLFAAIGVGASVIIGAGRGGDARVHQHRAQHDAVPDQRQRPDRHVAPGQQQLRRLWPYGGGLVIGLGGFGW